MFPECCEACRVFADLSAGMGRVPGHFKAEWKCACKHSCRYACVGGCQTSGKDASDCSCRASHHSKQMRHAAAVGCVFPAASDSLISSQHTAITTTHTHSFIHSCLPTGRRRSPHFQRCTPRSSAQKRQRSKRDAVVCTNAGCTAATRGQVRHTGREGVTCCT